MESGRTGFGRRKVGTTIILMGLLTGLFAVFGPTVSAAPIDTGSDIGNFEIDGALVDGKKPGDPPVLKPAANLVVDEVGKLDWAGLSDLASRVMFDDNLISPDPNLPGDDGYQGSSKEFDRSTWSCQAGAGATPGKDNIQYLFAYPALSINEAFVAMGFIRQSSEGNTNVVVELNQAAMNACSTVNDRTAGDLALHFDFPGGDDAAGLEAYLWSGTAWDAVSLPDGVANGSTNKDPLTLPASVQALVTPKGLPTTLPERTFGEVAIDLFALRDAVEDSGLGSHDVLSCPGVGYANIRTRSSGSSDESALHDNFPQSPFDLSDCASLKLKKVDDTGAPMAGIQFGLFATEAAAIAGTPIAQLPTTPPVNLVCTTGTDGTCTFPKVPDGDYYLNEINLPAGYTADPDLPMAVHLDPFQDLDLSDDDNDACAESITSEDCEWFVNSRQTGDVTITKNLEDADGNSIDLTEANVDDYDDFLVGAQFDLQQGNPLATADDADGDPLTCTIAASDINLTTNSASCVLDDVLYGDYTVHETAPQGTTPETNDQEVTVGDESVHVTVSFTNIINPDTVVLKSTTTPVVNAGDQVSFSLTVSNEGDAPALGVVLTDSLNTTITGWASSQPNPPCVIASNTLTCNVGTIDPGDEFSVTLTGTSTAASCPSITNQASVSSTNETEADAANNNSDVVTVTVNCPDVRVSKSTSTPSVNAGDPVAYSVVITNDGPGVATAVSFTDDLPDGVVWSFNGAPPAGCSLNGSNNLVCSFATMAVGSVTVNLQGTTDAADCPSITNPVSSVSASNEPSGVTGNNSTSAVTITVNCPDVDLAKVADDDVVSAGDPVGFTITVVNDGDGVATNVTVSDTLPAIAGYTWDFDDVVSDETDPCSLVGLALSCDFGDLSPEESASVHVFATLDEQAVAERACGDYENTGTVLFDNGSESDLSNNTDAVEILCPNVNLGKVADAAIVDAGDQIGFTITVSNIDDGEPPAEGTADVAVTDDLPGDLAWTVADDSDLEGGTCVILLGTLTCTWADLPAIDAEDAPQISVHVVADTTEADCGVYDNTASAVVANGVDPDDASASSRVRCPISIQLEKTGDALAHVGDVVDYQFTATNTGGEDLLNVELTDPECNVGSILLVDDADGDTVLAAGTWDAELEAFVGGEVWSYTCERTLTADDVVVIDGNDFALNTGSIRGEDADGREATDTDPHVVEIITPVIQVVKTVDDDTPAVGQTVTFTYVVTNTGDTTLFNVAVVDDQLGAIGTIPELAAGASTNLTKTMVVAATSPTRNIATATGADVLGKSVTDDDDATITIVLGEVITPPVVQPAVLVKTGADSSRLLILAGMLLLLGGLLVAADGGGAPIMVARRRHS